MTIRRFWKTGLKLQGLRAWLETRHVLVQLRSNQKAYSQRFQGVFVDEMEMAKITLDGGNPEQALRIWKKLHAEFPDLCVSSETGLNLLLDLGLYDDADSLMRDARRHNLARKSFLSAARARISYRRGNLEETIRLCKTLRREAPSSPEGYLLASTCLQNLGRLEEADTLSRYGVLKLPNDFNLHAQYASYAIHRRDWSEALRRWRLVTSRFQHFAGPIGAAKCLQEMGEVTEAENVLRAACSNFDTCPEPLIELALLSERIGDLQKAVEAWKVIMGRFPSIAIGYIKGAEMLHRIGAREEADGLLSAGMKKLPFDYSLSLAYARSAERDGKWSIAARRWACALGRFPQNGEICDGLTKANHMARCEEGNQQHNV